MQGTSGNDSYNNEYFAVKGKKQENRKEKNHWGWLVICGGVKCASNEASGFVHYHIIRILAFGCWFGQSDC